MDGEVIYLMIQEQRKSRRSGRKSAQDANITGMGNSWNGLVMRLKRLRVRIATFVNARSVQNSDH